MVSYPQCFFAALHQQLEAAIVLPWTDCDETLGSLWQDGGCANLLGALQHQVGRMLSGC